MSSKSSFVKYQQDNRFGNLDINIGKSENKLASNNYVFTNNIDGGLNGIRVSDGSHDIIIRNNTIYKNLKGITCSTDCYNIIIESNNVFDNDRFGIKLHNNVSNSTIAHNTVRDNKMEQISIYNSNNNSVNTNNIRGGEYGIIVVGSANNNMYNNVMANSSSYGLFLNSSSSGNIFHFNRIKDSLTSAIKINGSYAAKNFFNNNQLSDSFHAISLSDNSGTTFTNNTVTNIKNSAYLLSNVSEIRFNRTSFSYDIIESDGTEGNFIIIANSGTIGIKEDRSDKFVNYNTNRSTLNYNASKYAILDSKL